ncbi:MAG: hypothetical protein U0T11_09220 [Chitinophagaceae bacterium]
MEKINEEKCQLENNSLSQEKDNINATLSEMEQLELLAEIITEIYLKLQNGKTKQTRS